MIPDIEILTSRIKERLKAPLPGINAQTKLKPEIRIFSKETGDEKKAAVLTLLFPVNNRIHIAFIKRADYDGPHSGQISFPGGMFEKTDKNYIHTSLRESEEEIGVQKKDIKIIGNLSSLFVPISNIRVFPIVGYMNSTPEFKIDDKEVQRMILVPLSHLIKKENILWESRKFENVKYQIPYFNYKLDKIWGATAMILSEFLTVIEESVPDENSPQY